MHMYALDLDGKMRGHNQVWVSGEVGGRLVVGQTRDGGEACSFSMAIGGLRQTTWVRINAYGHLVSTLKEKAAKGAYLQVVGELMNRDGKCGELTEIRAVDIIFSNGTETKEELSNVKPEGSST